mmetsp:Transcript_2799/g.2797  ORF Transcript_2799/g.2797 Transcript_2799/m.2797 type:complete len:159 (+) Transcript_2799:71-547(+)
MSQPILFEDIFEVKQLNPDGKKFERVNRIHCRGTTYDVDLVVDVNAELFSIKSGERVTVALANTLALDGTPDDGQYNPFPGPSLLDSYDYAMHGRIFAIKHNAQQYRNVEVLASFGGLLFKLDGEQSQLQALEADSRVYLLMRKGAIDLGMDVVYRNE